MIDTDHNTKKITYTKILVPTKALQASEIAAIHAMHLASLDGAEVIFLTVLEDLERKNLTDGADTKQAAIKQHLRSFEMMAKELGVSCRSVILNGMNLLEGRVIVNYAALNGIDLIVLRTSSHRVHGMSQLTFGYVANVIINEANCPVLIVP